MCMIEPKHACDDLIAYASKDLDALIFGARGARGIFKGNVQSMAHRATKVGTSLFGFPTDGDDVIEGQM